MSEDKEIPGSLMRLTREDEQDAISQLVHFKGVINNTATAVKPVSFKKGKVTYAASHNVTTTILEANSAPYDSFLNTQKLKARRRKEIIMKEDQAQRDSLTGLYNHGKILEVLQAEMDYAKRSPKSSKKRQLAYVMLDIDHFKDINDTYGHGKGDEVLLRISKLLKKGVRKYDTVGRYGGEEFAMIFRGIGPKRLQYALARIDQQIQEQFFITTGKKFNCKVSMGAAFYSGKTNITDFVNLADKALYTSKEKGRSRITLGSINEEGNFHYRTLPKKV